MKKAAFTIQIKSIHLCVCVCVCVCVYIDKVDFSFVSMKMYCSYNKRLIFLNQLQGFQSWTFITYCKFSLKYNKSKLIYIT